MRDNYRALRYLAPDGDGFKPTQIFPELDHNTVSYTFSSDTGLLFATQFTQPALTLTEVAIYEDLKSRGLVSPTTAFAGHSLGEYAAIAAFGGLVPLETLMAIAFYRGLSMQVAVQRDSAGRSAFAMCALNPSKLSQGRFLSRACFEYSDRLSTFSNERGSVGPDCEDGVRDDRPADRDCQLQYPWATVRLCWRCENSPTILHP